MLTRMRWAMSFLLLGMFLMGCPPIELTEYDQGYADGYARTDWYWQGYLDSYYTDADNVYYQGGTIPDPNDDSYDDGYWDGVWEAYNEGYFASYEEMFVVGFYEGYDRAYAADYVDFLLEDEHTEIGNGGWEDGYNDGYSEGRVFGAWDYANDNEYDWATALLDYSDGIDRCIVEADVCSGEIPLYEYGTDPTAKNTANRNRHITAETPAIRKFVK